VFVWLNVALLGPDALPLNPASSFCLISSSTFAPFCAAFSFCVIRPEPVAVELSVCICVTALPMQEEFVPSQDWFAWLLPLRESCVIETD